MMCEGKYASYHAPLCRARETGRGPNDPLFSPGPVTTARNLGGAGDSLLEDGIPRPDFPEGSIKTLIAMCTA